MPAPAIDLVLARWSGRSAGPSTDRTGDRGDTSFIDIVGAGFDAGVR